MNKKTERIEIRCTPQQKEKINKKALKARKSTSLYALEIALEDN